MVLKNKYILFSFLLIAFFGCSKKSALYKEVEQIVSLNGVWKFQTFLGDGSNYLDIMPEPNDIIIDNNQKDLLERTGKWIFETVPQRESKCWGNGYLKHKFKNNKDDAYVRFKSKVPKTGFYEHFIYYPFSNNISTLVKVKHDDGITVKDFNQKNRTNVWLSLGVFKVDKNKSHYIEFTSATKGLTVADAVLLRPISEEEYRNAIKEKEAITNVNYNDSNWNNLKVPGHFGMLNQYSNYSGKGWYRKEIELPKTWKNNDDERIRIQFDGVYHVARVFFNGEFIGKHQGGFTPFEFDITEHIDFTGKNIITVEADNNYLVGATWNWGGIIRDVRLVKNKDVRIKYQYIHAEPNLKTGEANYIINVRIENNSAKNRTLNISTSILKNNTIDESNIEVEVASNTIKEFQIKGHLETEDVKLWHFDTPELYHLETTIAEEREIIDVKKERFGIRKFEATETQMLLNGEPVRLVGFNRVSDHRYWGSSEPQELINLDVDLLKESGANFTRIMHGTQNKKLLDRCDEKGILIFEEVNVRDLTMPEIYEDDYKYPKQWIKEMVERDVNHPCIVGWSTGNELKDHFEYVQMTYNYTKQLDPHRLVLHVSNQGYQKGESSKNNPLGTGDMIFQNVYQSNPGTVMDTLHKRWPNKAMFFSEFGVERFTTPDLDNDVNGLGAWYDNLRQQRPYTTGASIWTFNDYKSGYSQTLPEENRAWGMVNTWRTKRRAFYTHQKENSPITDLNIENLDLEQQSAIVSFNIRDTDDFPSFIMKDYKLQVTFHNKKGDTLSTTLADLPKLKPGMGQWQSNINWDKLDKSPYMLSVKLMTPNGYSRGFKNIYFDTPSQPVIDEVKTSKNTIRVHFTKSNNAFEYILKYEIEGSKQLIYKTIANYIELNNLPENKKVQLQLFALNNKGESKPSEAIGVKTTGQMLAPIIWDSFITDNNLIVGYSGDFEDVAYVIKYGESKDNLKHTFRSKSKGITIIPLNKENNIYFKIKRITKNGESQWSKLVRSTIKQNK